LVRTWLMGLAPASLLMLGLGLTGLLHPAVPAAALIGCAVPLATAGGGRVRWCRERWLAAAPCLLALPAALAPEIVFDALRYHLALPAAYLQIHKMVRLDR